jgi:hypothetical protein
MQDPLSLKQKWRFRLYKIVEFHDQPNNYKLIKEDSVSWR